MLFTGKSMPKLGFGSAAMRSEAFVYGFGNFGSGFNQRVLIFWAFLGCLFLASAAQSCERTLVAPASPTGLNVILQEDKVAGVFPDFMRLIGTLAGCQFEFPVLPRSRLDRDFFANNVDVLAPATQSTMRDKHADFIAWMELTPQLITASWDRETMPDLKSLLTSKSWRAVVVRNYSWGDLYDAFIKKMDQEGRLDLVSDLKTVHAMLRAGRAKFTILPPTLLYGSMHSGRGPAGLPPDFRYSLLSDLPRAKVGIYLNSTNVAKSDVEKIRAATITAKNDGSLLRILEYYYPVEILSADVVLNIPVHLEGRVGNRGKQ
ncbi:substrate-binding periplasmic protein [Roseateles oligotrophus]|uniref:Transporter substrate-binding domain-containing protein n=1 Tax=Roseateles oligotrophus TaxID=1769250 RepID=A0ABT2YH56_9BURK|nr:transporter substrate-binding domain-containing protein [Roseateles oligotrophus]MCV2369359.1 transporter substrate-binding domain-containing protein [Roseateles oligotrophus]